MVALFSSHAQCKLMNRRRPTLTDIVTNQKSHQAVPASLLPWSAIGCVAMRAHPGKMQPLSLRWLGLPRVPGLSIKYSPCHPRSWCIMLLARQKHNNSSCMKDDSILDPGNWKAPLTRAKWLVVHFDECEGCAGKTHIKEGV